MPRNIEDDIVRFYLNSPVGERADIIIARPEVVGAYFGNESQVGRRCCGRNIATAAIARGSVGLEEFEPLIAALFDAEDLPSGIREWHNDHIAHLTSVYLLLHYLVWSIFDRVIGRGFDFDIIQETTLPAFLHDIGYPISQNPFVTGRTTNDSPLGPLARYYSGLSAAQGGDPFDENTTIGGFIDRITRFRGINYADILTEELGRNNVDLDINDCLNRNPLDHGIISALLTLYLFGLRDSSDDLITSLVRRAAAAIAVHCLNHDAYRNGVPRIPFSRWPSAYLLILADELQVWNRTLNGSSGAVVERKDVFLDFYPGNIEVYLNRDINNLLSVQDRVYRKLENDCFAIRFNPVNIDPLNNL